jgi:hypothetical protein
MQLWALLTLRYLLILSGRRHSELLVAQANVDFTVPRAWKALVARVCIIIDVRNLLLICLLLMPAVPLCIVTTAVPPWLMCLKKMKRTTIMLDPAQQTHPLTKRLILTVMPRLRLVIPATLFGILKINCQSIAGLRAWGEPLPIWVRRIKLLLPQSELNVRGHLSMKVSSLRRCQALSSDRHSCLLSRVIPLIRPIPPSRGFLPTMIYRR